MLPLPSKKTRYPSSAGRWAGKFGRRRGQSRRRNDNRFGPPTAYPPFRSPSLLKGPGETEAGSAEVQPRRGIARWGSFEPMRAARGARWSRALFRLHRAETNIGRIDPPCLENFSDLSPKARSERPPSASRAEPLTPSSSGWDRIPDQSTQPSILSQPLTPPTSSSSPNADRNSKNYTQNIVRISMAKIVTRYIVTHSIRQSFEPLNPTIRRPW